MDNKPKALTSKEIKEIAAITDIQQMWGAVNAAEMEEMLDTTVYAVNSTTILAVPATLGIILSFKVTHWVRLLNLFETRGTHRNYRCPHSMNEKNAARLLAYTNSISSN